MKITFLGTGTSTGNPMLLCSCAACMSKDPRDTRLRASILLEENGMNLLIDCGPDFRQQALRVGLKHLSGVLITHEHYDHVGGLDDLRPFCLSEEMPLYAEKRVLDRLKITMPYSFRENPYPGVPLFGLNPIATTPFQINTLEIVPIRVMHFNLPVLGFRLGNFAYLTDFNHIEDSELNKLEGCDTLVVDALRISEHISHNSLAQALHVIEYVAPKQAYLIHMSHDMGLHADMEANLPDGVFFSYDGLILNI
jgi:phosphoribosyl 1,2-cyclic phosphate phosphodiesterase